MKVSNTPIRSITALLLLVLAIGFNALSQHQEAQWESNNSAIMKSFDLLVFVHSTIEKDLLRLNSNLINNFDSIGSLLSLYRATLSSLHKDMMVLLDDKYKIVLKPLKVYEYSFQKNIPLIDGYIRNMALLNNSLNYATHLFDQILLGLVEAEDDLLKAKLNTLMGEILRYLTNDRVTNDYDIKANIDILHTQLASINHPVLSDFDSLSKHLLVVVNGKNTANNNVIEILSSPHTKQFEFVYQNYIEQRDLAIRLFRLYDAISLVCGFLFVIFVLRIFYKQLVNVDKLSLQNTELENTVTESQESLLFINETLKNEIEQRVKAEEDLKDAAILYQYCIEGVLICDKKKRVLSVNPAYSNITGISANEITGKIPPIFDPLKSSIDVIQETNVAIESTGKWHSEIETLNANGTKTLKDVTIIGLKKNGEYYRYIVILADISERKAYEEMIYRQANYDALTQLPNRNLFLERAENSLALARRNKNKFATLFIDLDNFKKINDNYGHQAGDALLVEMASRLTNIIRQTDTASRFGGDEFIIILDNINKNCRLNIIVEKFRECLSTPVMIQETALDVTGSIGISIYPDDGDNISALIKCADIAMYRAKEQGKNTYCFFESKINADVHEYFELENELSNAIEKNELFLEYQPIVNSKTQVVHAFEALVRWNSSSLGHILPERFFPIAEESKLIVPIGAWILRTACEQLKDWNQNISDQLKISVAISAQQFKDPNFVDMLNQTIIDTDIIAHNLNIEIKENMVIEDDDNQIVSIFQNLKACGISVSLDNFDTGYSSLVYLKQFQVNELKIDHTFITNNENNEADESLIKAIINMANDLNINVVAKGVETEQQCQLLDTYQCHYIQGDHYGEPCIVEKLPLVLNANNQPVLALLDQ